MPKLNSLLQKAEAALAAGDFPRVERLSRAALDLAPDQTHALAWLGIALAAQGRPAAAIPFFRKAVALEPGDAGMLLNLGNALLEVRDFEPAAVTFEQALRIQPDHPEILNSLGCALAGQGRSTDAIARFRRAIASQPDYAEAHDNLGDVLLKSGYASEATESFRRAVAFQPDNASFLSGLGNALAAQHHWDEAIIQFERSLVHDPDFPDVHYNLAVARLFRQEYETGWRGYEARLQSSLFAAGGQVHPARLRLYERARRWKGPGEKVDGIVSVWAEQGIGDQILFSTLLPELASAGMPFSYEVDGRLLAAYRRAFPQTDFVPLEEPPGQALQRASRALLAGSLPGFFRRSRGDFARQPARLLQALPARASHYRQQLDAPAPAFKVGLSWRSTRTDFWGPWKSAPLSAAAPLTQKAGTRFVDLQYGDTRAERQGLEDVTGVRLAHFEGVDYYHDLEELLAILEACDLIITTSNVTAHLAGALGKPTWLLYPAARPPFHYWAAQTENHRSLWYPSVEIVTAPHLTDWDSLFRHAAGRLQAHIDTLARP